MSRLNFKKLDFAFSMPIFSLIALPAQADHENYYQTRTPPLQMTEVGYDEALNKSHVS